MIKYLIGMAGALAGMLVGGWLILAPFALAYQSSGAEWADPTYADFWSGLAILVISLIGMIMYAVGLFEELRRQGIIERREEPEGQQVQAAGMPARAGIQGGSGEIEQVLLPLVTAMLKDMQDQRRREENGEASQGGAPTQGGTAAPEQRLDPERRVQ